MLDIKNSHFSPLGFKVSTYSTKNDRLKLGSFSERLLLQWIASFIKGAFVKDHSALGLFSVTCYDHNNSLLSWVTSACLDMLVDGFLQHNVHISLFLILVLTSK